MRCPHLQSTRLLLLLTPHRIILVPAFSAGKLTQLTALLMTWTSLQHHLLLFPRLLLHRLMAGKMMMKTTGPAMSALLKFLLERLREKRIDLRLPQDRVRMSETPLDQVAERQLPHQSRRSPKYRDGRILGMISKTLCEFYVLQQIGKGLTLWCRNKTRWVWKSWSGREVFFNLLSRIRLLLRPSSWSLYLCVLVW